MEHLNTTKFLLALWKRCSPVMEKYLKPGLTVLMVKAQMERDRNMIGSCSIRRYFSTSLTPLSLVTLVQAPVGWAMKGGLQARQIDQECILKASSQVPPPLRRKYLMREKKMGKLGFRRRVMCRYVRGGSTVPLPMIK